MWLFLRESFVSVVADKEDNSMLWVRARSRSCLENMFGDNAKIKVSTNNDYNCRVKVDRIEFSRLLSTVALEDINYTNFKDSLKDVKRHRFYTNVWYVMLDFFYPKDNPSLHSQSFPKKKRII